MAPYGMGRDTRDEPMIKPEYTKYTNIILNNYKYVYSQQ